MPAAQRAASAMGSESMEDPSEGCSATESELFDSRVPAMNSEEYERLEFDGRRHVDCLVQCLRQT